MWDYLGKERGLRVGKREKGVGIWSKYGQSTYFQGNSLLNPISIYNK